MGSYKYLAKELEAKLERTKHPKLVRDCCIYKVPQKIRKAKPVAYTPQVISIGPLHRGIKRLEPMEELKLGYLKSYLERTHMNLEDSIEKLKEKEEDIRGCYSETISQSSDEFVKMILIDACFIIEYFLRFSEPHLWREIDPILSKQSWWNDTKMDLILLENQLPFFVFEDLFTVNGINGRQFSSFLEVCLFYFRVSYTIIDAESEHLSFTFDHEEVEVQHFTDLLRMLYLPCRKLRSQRTFESVKHLYSASRLLEAGLKLKVCQNKSLIELQYGEGELIMPRLLVDYDTETFFRNMAALEQCHYPREAYISDYLLLLDFLINERKDVDI